MAGTTIGTAYVQIMPSAKGMTGALQKELGGGATSAGKVAGTNIVSAIKGVIVGAGVAKFFSDAMSAGGKLQQSFGGLDTIYGEAAEGMKEMAYNAAQAGLSANDYAEQAVSFGAALRQAYGGDMVAAAKAADTAIMDMTDNSAKMGTNIADIQHAYQGFAKQNYTMLDNLKLGYGGTKTEMQRLLSDAEALSGVKYDMSNLGDVYEAIHVIQEQLGLTGVAAKEGAETYTGSMQAMKASTQNLLANLSLGKDIKAPLKSLVGNTAAYLKNNMLPMIGNTLKGVGSLAGEALQTGLRNLPMLGEAAKGLMNRLTDAIKNGGGGEAFQKIKSVALDFGRYFANAFKYTDWAGIGKSVLNLLTTGVQKYAPMLLNGFKTVGSKAVEWFQSVNWPNVGKKAVQLLGDGIGAVGSWIAPKVKDLASKAANFFENTNWSEAGSKAVEMIGSGIKSVGSFLWEGLKGIAKTAADHFKNNDVDWSSVGGSVIRAIGSGAKAIGSFLWSALKTIGKAAAEKFKDINWADVGSSVVRFIGSGLKSIGSFIWNGLKGIGETAIENFKGINWSETGSSIINLIVSGITSLGTSIGTWLKHWGSEALGKFLDVDWVGLGNSVINTIVGGLSDFGHFIGETLLGIGNDGKDEITGIDWYGAGAQIVGDLEDGLLGNPVDDAVQVIANTIIGTLGIDATQLGANTSGSYASGIKSQGKTVSEAAEEIRGKAEGGLSDSGTAYTWGSHFGANLASGILAQVGSISSAVATVAGILSQLEHTVPKTGPLKHDDEWGGHFVDNFANGIKKNTYKVKNAVKGMTTAAMIDTNTMSYRPAMAYAGGTGMSNASTWNVTVNGAENPDIWARKLVREAKQYSRIS